MNELWKPFHASRSTATLGGGRGEVEMKRAYITVTRSKFWTTPAGAVLALAIGLTLCIAGIAALGAVGAALDWVL